MPNGLFVNRTEWNEFIKRFNYLEEYVKNSMREKRKSTWMTKQEAMEEIGCKGATLERLRYSGAIEWKYSGKGRGVIIFRKSVEEHNLKNSTLFQTVK